MFPSITFLIITLSILVESIKLSPSVSCKLNSSVIPFCASLSIELLASDSLLLAISGISALYLAI